MWGTTLTGGTVTFTEIGKRLIKKGHEVSITFLDDHQNVKTPQGYKPKYEPDTPIEYIRAPLPPRFWRYGWYLLHKYLYPYRNCDEYEKIGRIIPHIPDCDINVATWYPSAFAVHWSGKGTEMFYHMQHYEPYFFDPSRLGGLYNERISQASYYLPLHRIANCTWLQGMVAKKHGGYSEVVNHAIRHDVFYPEDVEKGKKYRILCLGKTRERWKGLPTLAEALNILKLPDAELVLYGREKRPSLDYPFTYYYNPSWDALRKLYCSADLVVCPSWYESFPAPPLEGMACGVPVVTTRIGTEDYAMDRVNSLVVPPKDPGKMADAIRELHDHRYLGEELAKVGLKTASQFTWDKTAEKVEKLFIKALRTDSYPY